LLAPGALALPGGLRVGDRTDLDALRLAVGEEVTVGDGRVLARDTGLVVRRTWRPQRVLSTTLSPAARATSLAALSGLTAIEDDLGPLLTILAQEVALGLGRPAHDLVGLGPGLTP